MTYADYLSSAVGDSAGQESAGTLERENVRTSLVARGVPENVVENLFASPMLAVVEPMRAPYPRFPLVVIAQEEGENAADQAVLAEFLTSYGYIVATCPSPTRSTGPMTSAADTARVTEDQVADLAFVTSRVRTRADVAPRQLAVIAHGFGARAALLFSMRNSVRALVSLDGGIGIRGGTTGLERATAFNPSATKVPVLHMYQVQDSLMVPDFGVLSSLGSRELWRAQTTGLRHRHFTTLGAAAAAFPKIGEATGATLLTGSDYGSVLRETLVFLDAFMKGLPEPFRKAPALPLAKIMSTN
jgi:hypothetical protein